MNETEYAPGDPAPFSGTYELLNVLGLPSKTRIPRQQESGCRQRLWAGRGALWAPGRLEGFDIIAGHLSMPKVDVSSLARHAQTILDINFKCARAKKR